jgi:hypothetical protein
VAPASAAQLAFEFLMVMLTANNTPDLSSRISERTYDEGVCVGKGPSVSVGVTAQLPEPVPVPVPDPEPELEVTSAFLQAAWMIKGTEVAPISMLRRNFFLDCSIAIVLGG